MDVDWVRMMEDSLIPASSQEQAMDRASALSGEGSMGRRGKVHRPTFQNVWKDAFRKATPRAIGDGWRKGSAAMPLVLLFLGMVSPFLMNGQGHASEPGDPSVDPTLSLFYSFRSPIPKGLKDLSLLQHQGEMKGSAQVADGRLGLDGEGSHVEVSGSPRFSLANGLAVAVTVRLNRQKNHIVAGKLEEWLLGFSADGRLYFNIKSRSGSWSCDTKSAANILEGGAWGHVAAIYRPNADPLSAAKGRVELYLNGTQVGSREMLLEPAQGEGPFRIGRLWGDGNEAKTWDMSGDIREVQVWSRALGPSEIIARACEQPEVRVDPLAFEAVPDVAGNRLGIRVESRLSSFARALFQASVSKGEAVLQVTVKGPRGEVGESEKAQFNYGSPLTTYWMPYPWSDGNHLIHLKLTGGGQVLTTSRTVNKPPTPWLGQGKPPSEVLTPWSPLKTDGGRGVECWGRRYRFEGPLPRSIQNQGREMLRGPITLELQKGEKWSRFEETRRSAVVEGPVRAEYKGEGVFSGQGDIGVSWTSWIEYDGVTWATVTLDPGAKAVNIEGLRLTIPLRPEMTKYLFGAMGEHPLKFKGHGSSASRPLRLDGQRIEWGRFMPYLWLQNLEEGFVWFADSDANWVNGGRGPIVVDGGTEAGITLRLVDKPVALPGPVTYSFGFQATPVKPLRADRFSRRWGETAHQPGVSDYVYLPGFAERTGMWLPVDAPKLKKVLDDRWSKSIHCFLYGSINGTGDHCPVYDFFEPLWRAPGGYVFGPFNHGRNFPSYLQNGRRVNPYIGDDLLKSQVDHNLARVNPGIPSYADYLTWTAEELQRQAGPASLYTDLASHVDPAWTTDLNKVNPAHLETDQFGRRVFNYGILAVRDLARRLANLVRRSSTKERPLTWMAHDQNRFCPVYHGYADWWFPGEQYDDTCAKEGPFALMDGTISPEQFRVECGGAQASGVPGVLLTHFLGWGFKREPGYWGASNLKGPATAEEKNAASDSVIGRCALEGVEFLAAWHMKDQAPEWWKLRERSGLGSSGAPFRPYWRPDCPVKSDSEGSVVSAYGFDGQRCVILIANSGAKDAVITVSVDLAGLEWPAGREPSITDERTGAAIAWNKGSFAVAVKGRNYGVASLTLRPVTRTE